MIAARFRQVGWTAAVAGAALCCYLASQGVAAERAALAATDRQIARTEADIMRLETEIAARSRLGQVERWNSAAFALQAPAPRQYVASEVQLASLAGGKPLPLEPVVQADRSAVQTVAYAVPAALPAQHAIAAAVAEPQLRVATYVRPNTSALSRTAEAPIIGAALDRVVADALVEPAPAKPRLVAATLLPDDLGRLAAAEKTSKAAKPVRESR